METDLSNIRAELDAIDDQLVDLFVMRMRAVARVAAFKRGSGLPVRDEAREAQILDRVANRAGPDLAASARALYQTLFGLSRAYQAREAQPRPDARNLVLVGMPGCGKTTLGRAAAALLSRPFVDLDEEIEAASGRPAGEVLERLGEPAFRELEAGLTARWAAERGLVIATGGGTVLRADNTAALRRGGLVVWIRRPLELLSVVGRPLSAGPDALRRMEAVRMPIYAACADAAVDNTGTVGDAAREIAAIVRAAGEEGSP